MTINLQVQPPKRSPFDQYRDGEGNPLAELEDTVAHLQAKLATEAAAKAQLAGRLAACKLEDQIVSALRAVSPVCSQTCPPSNSSPGAPVWTLYDVPPPVMYFMLHCMHQPCAWTASVPSDNLPDFPEKCVPACTSEPHTKACYA